MIAGFVLHYVGQAIAFPLILLWRMLRALPYLTWLVIAGSLWLPARVIGSLVGVVGGWYLIWLEAQYAHWPYWGIVYFGVVWLFACSIVRRFVEPFLRRFLPNAPPPRAAKIKPVRVPVIRSLVRAVDAPDERTAVGRLPAHLRAVMLPPDAGRPPERREEAESGPEPDGQQAALG